MKELGQSVLRPHTLPTHFLRGNFWMLKEFKPAPTEDLSLKLAVTTLAPAEAAKNSRNAAEINPTQVGPEKHRLAAGIFSPSPLNATSGKATFN